VLGPRRKYSSCYWPADCATLAEAEEHALRITAERAGVEDGMRVLELGCGWGSLTLWLAEKFPRLRVTAVSNSHGQREYIEQQVRERGWQGRVNIITADMNDFQAPGPFDRVVSVEMFEHMRNYQQLFRRIASWLTPQGKLFVHVFCHRQLAYPFDTDGAANWMGRYFFTGGIMPSADLFSRFADDLRVARQWTWNGQHYARTAEAWVQNMDAHRSAIMPILSQTYGSAQAARWFRRWRMLFLAGAELFGYANGEEWRVDHYLLERAQVNGDAT
jgi:cyclopropane-fatty-acyl-phospholipid synthase